MFLTPVQEGLSSKFPKSSSPVWERRGAQSPGRDLRVASPSGVLSDEVKPVNLVSQDGDDMLSAMTLTHTGRKEGLRTLGCNGGSRLQDRSPVCSLLLATRMVTYLLTSFMPHARQSWGGPCPAKPTGSSSSMPSPADLQERETENIPHGHGISRFSHNGHGLQ